MYALFHQGKYYRVRDVDGFLRLMREDPDFRLASIELLKGYCRVSDEIDGLAESGKLLVSGEPNKMDEMTKNFAMLVKERFPEEWEKA